MGGVPLDIQEKVGAVLAPIVLSTISSIRTRFIDQKDEHSGTALLLSDEQGNTFCFTANHVVTPLSRTPPRTDNVVQHSYFENHSDVGSFRPIGDGRPMWPICLRRKYFKSEISDLAILESCLNGFETNGVLRKNYFKYALLSQARMTEIFLDDVFVICGLPSFGTLPIAATGETQHRLLVHFFSGSEGAEHPKDNSRYVLKYLGNNPAPGGMSGSPVWLIRESSEPTKALSYARIRMRSDKPEPLDLQIAFAGLVVSHDPLSERIQAVRPEVCAEFALKAQQELPKLRDTTEDKFIDEQLSWWLERYRNWVKRED